MIKLSIRAALSLGAGLLVTCGALAQESLVPPNPATPTTERANAAMLQAVAAFDPADFANATRGKLAELPEAVVKTADGRIAWDARRYDFLAGDPPDTVNPSLWRHQQLNAIAGLFEVTEGIYQFRGYDIANMTLVEGETGWIVIDTMLTAEVARAGLELAMNHLGSTKPVVAVIYTHSHADHFGGVRGVVDEADVLAGKVKIYAPEGFMEHAIAENVLAGNAMSRRAQYMYGVALPLDPQGSLGTGLGLSLSNGTPGLIPPTDYVTRTGEELTIDGVRIQFQMAHGTEAPAEMMFYFPDKKVLCVSEVANRLMHNVYTIRGAKVRDALLWSKVLNETLDLFPDAEIAMGVHFWPAWGRDDIRRFLTNQRDTYRFIHDRALHLANKGQTKSEIGNADFFPRGLAADASSRGYYGSLSHNMRAVYNFYLGFYDANPATLDPLPRAEVARRYVAALGGEAAVLALGRTAFRRGGLPLGGRAAQPRGVREPGKRRGARAAGRRAGAAGIPGRVGYLAQRLPDGRLRAAQRCAEVRTQHRQPGHRPRHVQRAAVRLHRAAAGPREDRRPQGIDQHGVHRQQRDLGAGAVEFRAQQHPRPRARQPRPHAQADPPGVPGDAAAGQDGGGTGTGGHDRGRRGPAGFRRDRRQHRRLRPDVQHRHALTRASGSVRRRTECGAGRHSPARLYSPASRAVSTRSPSPRCMSSMPRSIDQVVAEASAARNCCSCSMTPSRRRTCAWRQGARY
jgi:alkyl sulfatase BDS1-like metallo-beta-lactamase superfamily hydrolase